MKIKKINELFSIKKELAINQVEDLLVSQLYKKFPEVYYTTVITKWNDGTFMVEIIHGIMKEKENKGVNHHWRWYNNEITHWTQEVERPKLK